MTRVTGILVAVAIVTFQLLVPGLSVALEVGLEDYCCVCGPCDSGAPRLCVSAVAKGSVDAACAERCNDAACRFVETLDGTCNANAGTCMPSPAPAASHSVLFAMGVLLAGGGISLVRRRVIR
jgi:hypothetical protein